MKNRRQDYRHEFARTDRIRATLLSLGQNPIHLSGEITNLSTGGMEVKIEGGNGASAYAGPWIVQFCLPSESPLSLSAVLVHRRGADSGTYGFRFLPVADPVAQERHERVIWRFLLQEQRGSRAT